jgi:hypothetical protein
VENYVLRNRNEIDGAFTWVSVDCQVESLEPSSLAHIYSFHKALKAMLEDKIEKIMMGSEPAHVASVALLLRGHMGSEPAHVASVALLLRGHMIIGSWMSADEVLEWLRPI